MKSARSKLNRVPSRGHYDRETIYGILDKNFLCQVAFLIDGKPYCIPTAYGRKGDYFYIHGSSKSQMTRVLAEGGDACITVMQVDGIVLARSLFHSSMNYQSVVLFGKGEELLSDDEKNEGLLIVSESICPGRWDEARLPNDGELKATTVLRFPLNEGSAKIRAEGANDDKADYALDIWAGVIPIHTYYGEPESDDKLKPSIVIPKSVKKMLDKKEPKS